MEKLIQELLNAKRLFEVGVAGHRLEMLECEQCVKRARVLALLVVATPYEQRYLMFLDAIRKAHVDLERNAMLRELLDMQISDIDRVVDTIVFYDL